MTLPILMYTIGTESNIWISLTLEISEDSLISWAREQCMLLQLRLDHTWEKISSSSETQ